MVSRCREAGSPVYGSSFVTICDIVLLRKRNVEELSEKQNEGETAFKTETSGESYVALEVLTMIHRCRAKTGLPT